MKQKYRISISILIIFCMIVACGCSSNKENIEMLQKQFPDATITEKGGTITMVRPVDFDAVEVPEKVAGTGSSPAYENFEQMSSRDLWLDRCVIFRGKKDGNSLQTTHFNKDMLCTGYYSVTPITVVDAYYGDVQEGTTIYYKENAAVLTDMSGETAVQTFGVSPIKGEEEYIFVLQLSSLTDSSDHKIYALLSGSYAPFVLDDVVKMAKDKNTFLEKKEEQLLHDSQSHGITGYEEVYADILEKYYYPASPDLRLDEAAEMRKMIEANAGKILSQTEEKERLETLKNDTSATKEQLREGLTDEQIKLLDRMCQKYGTVSAEKK